MSTFYATIPPKRFFRIPEDAEPPPGDLRLQSLTGQTLEIDAEAATEWELSEEDAKALVQERIGLIAGGVGAALDHVREVLVGVSANQDAAGNQDSRVDDTIREGTERVADAMGEDPDDLGSQEVFARGLGRLVGGMRDSIKAAAALAPASPDQVQERMATLSAALRAEGSRAGESLGDLTDRLGDTLRDPKLETEVRAATERLRAATERLRGRDDPTR